MANVDIVSASEVQLWEDKYFAEYVRENLFAPYMGTDENSVIQTIENLTKAKGDTINVPMVTRLTNAGVTGDSTLEGNEEALGNYNHALEVNQLRNGVRVGRMENQRTVIDVMNAARTMLKLWSMDQLRDDIIAAMLSPVVDGVTAYASASETQKDAWLAANSDRVLFGAVKSNNAANDHSAALAEIDNTTDKLDADIVSLAKRMAKTADRHIRPITVKGGEEWFVMFCNSLAFRDLKTDSTILQANREAWMRGKDNPLFRDGDILWDGVICREVPEIAVLSGVGASSIDVAPNFLCGAQAVGVAWAQRPKFTTEEFDYGNLMGVATSEIRAVEKLMFNSVQNMVTVYTAGVADS